MLQAGLGGYQLVSEGENELVSNPTYYEPGFNIMYPLEISVSTADRVYILIRKRADSSGNLFDQISVNNLEVEIKDSVNGMSIPYNIKLNDIDEDWNTDISDNIPVLLDIINSIDLSNPIVRSRSIDCIVKDTTDNDCIIFRITVNDEDKYFHYIPVESANMSERSFYTMMGRDVYIKVNSYSDYYILFSPYAYLVEKDKNNYDFSFPLNSIFYKRQNTFGNEDYNFSIVSYSHDFVSETISVMNVPGYNKAGVILVDRMMYKQLINAEENAYVEIGILGKLSGIVDTFKVNFTV